MSNAAAAAAADGMVAVGIMADFLMLFHNFQTTYMYVYGPVVTGY